MAAPALPTRFPCWVKAVYSWGGETKRDLGFMEGDLIECLNAGDGMWWMGRLRRDRRMAGLFPSNFVQVLEESFQPAPNRSSPITSVNPSRTSSPGPHVPGSGPSTPSPTKSLFRKPFRAYSRPGSPTSQAGGRETSRSSPAGSVNKIGMPKPFSSMKEVDYNDSPTSVVNSRPPSPTIPAPVPRADSFRSRHGYDQPIRSSSPFINGSATHHDPSYLEHREDSSSPPPPPPPAHRVKYGGNEQYAPSSEIPQYNGHPSTPPSHSPAPSAHTNGMTPSPLREAMNDVMSSLEGMSVPAQEFDHQEPETAGPSNLWSPEAFEELYSQPTRSARPHTSIGIGDSQTFNDDDDDTYNLQNPTQADYHQFAEEQQNSYVQRMESRLRQLQQEDRMHNQFTHQLDSSPGPPTPPPKGSPYALGVSHSNTGSRPRSAHCEASTNFNSKDGTFQNNSQPHKTLKTRKSAYELGKAALNRTFTNRSNGTATSSTAQSSSTSDSNSTQLTGQSVMSGHSAGGFSATSAGSLARRKWGRSGSIVERPKSVAEVQRPATAASGFSFQSDDDSGPKKAVGSSSIYSIPAENNAVFGGLTTPIAKKRGFLGKVLDSVKTGAASARSNMGSTPQSRPSSPQKHSMPQAVSSASPSNQGRDAAREMGLGGGNGDWVQMRRDVNRSNSLSRIERTDRIERCQMMDIPVLTPVDSLYDTAQGDEASDGSCVENPTDFSACNLALVDKSARFVNNLPVVINSASLAHTYLCRQYRSDVQRLRAIFTWVSEKITWEEDFEGDVDTRRVIQTRRGCSQEIAVLVSEMCTGAGVHAEVIRGTLKTPGEAIYLEDLNDAAPQPNHWWNAVIVDGEWRIMDCSLASPRNPKRAAYTSTSSQVAESYWFLARPMEICYTHVPLLPRDQHIVPPLPHEVLMALPVASPAFFRNQLQLWDFDTSLLHLDGLEMAHIQLSVPDGVECTGEVEARAFTKDADGDLFESGEVKKKRALAQGEFISVSNGNFGGPSPPFKRYTIKAVLPSGTDSSSVAVLKIYAGGRGLQHSIASNPHSLALSLPLSHSGPNPAYEFFVRHPTPHALRNEIYITSPLCKRLTFNSTFVFGVRQHPASISVPRSKNDAERRARSPGPSRPGSALSMASVSASGSATSNTASNSSSGSSNDSTQQNVAQEKPAKMAIQSPSGKILRMTRKMEPQAKRGREPDDDGGVVKVGSQWETIIKIGERGTWRGLVLADRSARWCVFGEWECP